MISFLNIESNYQAPFKSKLLIFIKYYFLSLLVKIIGGIAISVSSLLGIQSVLELLNQKSNFTDHYPLEISILLIILIFPILEEFAFRGWISKNRLLITASMTILLFYCLYIVMFRWLDGIVHVEYAYKVVIIICILFVGLWFFYNNASLVSNVVAKKSEIIVLISILSFGLIHILNYNLTGFKLATILPLLIIILPHFFSAYILTYVRIKNGILWSIILHALNNSIILIPVLMGEKSI